eukprot:gene11907-biopygen369
MSRSASRLLFGRVRPPAAARQKIRGAVSMTHRYPPRGMAHAAGAPALYPRKSRLGGWLCGYAVWSIFDAFWYRKPLKYTACQHPGLATGWTGLGTFLTLFGAFLGSKTARNGLKCAPQRRVYLRSLSKCPIDGTHGCAQKMVFSVCTGAAVRACVCPKDAYFRTAILRGASSESSRAGHRLDRPGGTFLTLFGAFLVSKAARNGLKCAPQRRVYPRSLAKCPIDGTH